MLKNDYKRKSKWMCIVAALSFMVLLGACSNASGSEPVKGDDADTATIRVVTTIAQIAEPLSVIGGDRIEVSSLMGPGIDPHLFNASQGDILTLQAADIVMYNGLYLEGNMTEIFAEMSKQKPVFALGESLDEALLLVEEDGAIDPHIWFDIDLWQQALDQAVEQLKLLSPDDTDYFEARKQAYFLQLAELKEEAEKLGSIPDERRVLVTAHDAFGYFGRMHDIEVVGLQGLSTEDEIGISDIQQTINLLVTRQIPAVFVESTISEKSIRSVIEGAAEAGQEVRLGGKLFSDAMGEEGSEEGTYIGMYRHNIQTIYQALTEKGDDA